MVYVVVCRVQGVGLGVSTSGGRPWKNPFLLARCGAPELQGDWKFIAKEPASAPHMLRIMPRTVPRVGRSCEHFPDGFELHLILSRS